MILEATRESADDERCGNADPSLRGIAVESITGTPAFITTEAEGFGGRR